MKKLISKIIVLSFISIIANAQSQSNSIKAYDIPVCTLWTFDTQVMGYVCMNPNNVVLPDGYSVRNAVAELEAKISALEARIKVLEEK